MEACTFSVLPSSTKGLFDGTKNSRMSLMLFLSLFSTFFKALGVLQPFEYPFIGVLQAGFFGESHENESLASPFDPLALRVSLAG